ncbi:MAG: chorismate mutase [Proteobacteria bacterium]|nr:chorismate mutase [Pseudomonadota bacterium]
MKQCTTLEEVRSEIDQIDRGIVALITERLEYIRQAGHIKQNRTEIRDPARVDDIITKVMAETRHSGGDQNLVALIYRVMVEWCITYELAVFDNSK